MDPVAPKKLPARRRKAGDVLTDACRVGEHDACRPEDEAIAADGCPTSCGCGHHYSAGPATPCD